MQSPDRLSAPSSPGSPSPSFTLLQNDGFAELLGADGEILLLAGGDDGLKVIIASLWGQWGNGAFSPSMTLQQHAQCPGSGAFVPTARQAGLKGRGWGRLRSYPGLPLP